MKKQDKAACNNTIFLITGLIILILLFGIMPGLPVKDAEAIPKTFAADSLIIPMDTTYQDYGMFKAYGLVYNLLQNNIPVSWAIANSKAFGGADFTATTVDLATSTPIGSPYTYTGGPFIIDSAYSAQAQTLINNWWAANGNQPKVHKATASFTANVDIVLTRAPRIALDAVNAGIAIAYFNAAGIPDLYGNVWSSSSPNVLSETMIACDNPTSCAGDTVLGNGALFTAGACSQRRFDTYVTPHNGGFDYSLTDPTDLGTQTYAELDYFVYQGGGWTALCHSILSNENNISDLYHNSSPTVRALFQSSSDGGFLTQYGFPAIDNKGQEGTWFVNKPDLPLTQAVPTASGTLQKLPGGSVQTWHQPDGSANYVQYWAATERAAWFTDGGVQYDWAVNGAYHNGTGRGKVTFLGGHSYSTDLPYSTNFQAPYLRFFYNSLFFNGEAVANLSFNVTPSSISQGSPATVSIALTNSGASTATGVGGVTVTLQPGVTYEGTTGPAPHSVVVNGDGTTTLTYDPLGDVSAGATLLTITATAYYATPGQMPVATASAGYGDVFDESFTTHACSSVTVNPVPIAVITKTPSTQGPVAVGSVVTWTITYSNTGSAPLLDPYVEDTLPANLSFENSTPQPTYVVPLPSGEIMHWTLPSPLAAGASGTISLQAVVQSHQSTPFTNNVTLAGTDANLKVYSSSAQATVSVLQPVADLIKSVSPAGAVFPGATLTYTLEPSSPGPTLMNDIRFFDAPPLNTTYVTGSVSPSNLGTYGAYTPRAGEQGVDAGGDPETTMDITEGVSPYTYQVGSTITVTMALHNGSRSSAPITNVSASLYPSDGLSNCVALSAQPVSIGINSTVDVTFTCTVGGIGEIYWTGYASGTFSGGTYYFSSARSPTILGIGSPTGSSILQWVPTLNKSNTAAVPGKNYTPGTEPGIFALDGGGTNIWERYNTQGNSWVKSGAGLTSNLPGNVGYGGALVYDGGGYANGYVYALQGNGTTGFWRYKLSDGTTGSWATLAPAPWNVGAGGAITKLGNFIYALQGGNTTGFARYDITNQQWTTLADVPDNVNQGGALATDGTYIYAINGNGKNTLYRYDPPPPSGGVGTWLRMANAPWNIKDGGALVSIGTTIYALRGDNQKSFAKFVPNGATGAWTDLSDTPDNVKQGGALTTDGTTIWAFQGNNKSLFWAYDPGTNLWTSRTSALDNINAGGALAWIPGSQSATTTNSLSAPVLVTGSLASPATITVTQTLTSTIAASDLLPTAMTITTSHTGTPSCTYSPSGAQSIAAGGTVTFTWTCTNVYAGDSNANLNLGMITFSAGATDTTPETTWTAATSNSVLVTQPLTYQVTVNSTPTDFTDVINIAQLGDALAFSGAVGSNLVDTPIQRDPNLVMTKSVSPDSGTEVSPGSTLTYTIEVLNTTYGATTAGTEVTDAVPAGTTYGGCTTTQGSCSEAGGTVTYSLGVVPAYGTATLTMTVTVDPPTLAGLTTIPNTASVSYTGDISHTTFSGTSNTVENTMLTSPAVTISKAESVSPAPDSNGMITPGSTITYTMTVSNPLDAVTAESVVVTDNVPSGATYSSCSTTSGSCLQVSGVVTYTIGTMAPNSSVTLTMVVTVNSPAVDGGSIVNSASVSAATNIEGTSYTQSSNIVSYGISAAPIISISKSSYPASGNNVAPGDTITYTLIVKNTGTANTDSAYVQDNIPANTVYVANSTTINGQSYPEVTPGVAPVAGGMKVYSPGYGDASGDGGTLLVETPIGDPSHDAIITFQVIIDTDIFYRTAITNTATAGTAATEAVTSNTVTLYAVPTLVTLSGFSAENDGGSLRVKWTTSSEQGTAGFYLFRYDETSGRVKLVNGRLVPAVLSSPQGGNYNLIDRKGDMAGPNTYYLMEVENNDTRNIYGPYTVTAGGGNAIGSVSDAGPIVYDPDGKNGGKIDWSNIMETADDGADMSPSYTSDAPAMPATVKTRLDELKVAKHQAEQLRQGRSGISVKIPVSSDGLYYLSASEMERLLNIGEASIRTKIAHGDLALTDMGKSVSYLADADSGGVFFYGYAPTSIYATDNIYWLSLGKGSPMQATGGSGPQPSTETRSFTETRHFEENHYPAPVIFSDPESDYWLWDYVIAGAGEKTFTLQADGVAETTADATLKVNLQGDTDIPGVTDHHVKITLNGTVVGEGTWDGMTAKQVVCSFSQGLLKEGANVVSISGILDDGVAYSLFYLNSFDLTYKRLYQAEADSLMLRGGGAQIVTVSGFTGPDIAVFDMSDPDNPVFVTATTVDGDSGDYRVSFRPASPTTPYIAVRTGAATPVADAWADTPSSLHSGNNRADYLVIAPDELIDGAQALADYRSGQGLQTMVVNLEDIMDEFNYGVSSPHAIRDFLSYAYYNWKKAPAYVVLVGEGSYDYKNYLGYGDSLVPPLLVSTPSGLAPSDNALGDVDGDYLPEMAIGRLSVVSPAELQDVLDKIVAYETGQTGNEVIMLADNADEGGDFPLDSDELTSLIPRIYPVSKIYLSQYSVSAARTLLMDRIDAGSWLLNYIGHASVGGLAQEGLLVTADVAGLKNAGRYPLVTAFTCVVGQFAIPGYDSLSETLVVTKDAGASGMWSATGFAYDSMSQVLAREFFDTLFSPGQKRLGDTILDALRAAAADGVPGYVMDIYNLQGDPALELGY